MEHEEQGGGALLDLSYEIDYMRWLCGEIHIDGVRGFVGKMSDLDINSDDCVDFVAGFGTVFHRVLASIHMDLLDRSYNRRLRIVGSEGTISWDWNDGNVKLYGRHGGCGQMGYDPDRNIQFKEEMKAFVDSVQSGIPHPTLATLDDGIEVLKVVLELKKQNGR